MPNTPNSPTAQAFYDHKREAHNGEYERNCSECKAKWAALLEEHHAAA